MLDVSREEIVEGSIPRVLALLALPLVVQNLVQVVQSVVDTFWVGRLGGNAVAAVGLNFPVTAFLLSAVVMAPLVGTQVLVSQRVGAESFTGARRIAVNALAVAVAAATLLAVVVVVGAGQVVALLGAGPAVAPEATAYLATYVVALPVIAASDVLEGGFIGWGDSRAALYINVVAVVVNIGLDPVFIFGWWVIPAYGVQGAAMATVLGYAAGFLLAAAMVAGARDSFTLTWDAATLDRAEVRELLDVGAPSAGRRLAQDVVRVVLVGVVGVVGGAAALTAYTIGARVASVAFIPAGGLQQATQSVVGQNLGAGRPDRAGRATWTGVVIATGALGLVGVGQLVAPTALASVFVPDIDPAALALTVDYLRILALGYWAIGAAYCFRAGFNGARRTRTSLVASLLQYWVVRLPIAVVGAFALDFGVHAVFWAVTLSNVAAAVGAGVYYVHTTADGMFDRAAETAQSAAATDGGERPDGSRASSEHGSDGGMTGDD